MARFFISYRREDSSQITGRIYEYIERYFGKGSIFVDVDDIPAGVNFRDHIHSVISQCDAMLVVIGSAWLPGLRERVSKGAEDFVKIELEEALAQKTPLVPILIDGAEMPARDRLPDSIAALSDINALRVETGSQFSQSMAQLSDVLERTRIQRAFERKRFIVPQLVHHTPSLFVWLLENEMADRGIYEYTSEKITLYGNYFPYVHVEEARASKICIFPYRIIQDVASLIEIHFLITPYFENVEQQLFHIGWIIDFFQHNPEFQPDRLKAYGNGALNEVLPEESVLRILPSNTDPREIWKTINTDPYILSTAYIVRFTL